MIFSFLSDVLSSRIGLEATSLSDSSLSYMIPGFIDLQLDAIYRTEVHALFISELAKRSSENNICVSSIESAIYAIKWGHPMVSFVACPVSHPLVKFALEGTKRRLV